ncbi:MAG TPA: ATP-binding protein [Armatimonadota bacterium]|nr:ATP-binding protein [Armatimonadota bacterium]HPP73862.1 ATP-binding protein [Armatimonadota bacterium]
MSSDRINAFIRALELDPENHSLRLILAEALEAEEEIHEAVMQYDTLLQSDNLPASHAIRAGRLAVEAGRPEMAMRCLSVARRAGVIDGVSELEKALNENLANLGVLGREQEIVDDSPEFVLKDIFYQGKTVTFSEVGGLDDIKKVIHRKIILPFQRPDLYQKYGKTAGGGVMLYGPPGCGKTLLARATAGECNLPFLNIRIEDILNPWIGMSEGNLHEAFETARKSAPCVLFIDELDAIAFSRRKHIGSSGRPLVDQLLQELDAIGVDNTGLLILAASNAPWDVDDALKRPGRFDRTIFVPPPDEPARLQILKIQLSSVPTASVDLKKLAKNTPLFSGADLKSLVDYAVDQAIEEALDTGTEPPVSMLHLESGLSHIRPTTLEWLASARNYVEFANQAGQYDEVAVFLRSREAKKWKDLPEH